MNPAHDRRINVVMMLVLILTLFLARDETLAITELNVATVCRIYSNGTSTKHQSQTNRTPDSLCGPTIYPDYTILCEMLDYAISQQNTVLFEYGVQLKNQKSIYCNSDTQSNSGSHQLPMNASDMCSPSERNGIVAIFSTMEPGWADIGGVIFGKKCIPLLPVLTSSSELSLLKNFIRTLPPYEYTIDIILQLLHQLKINYVSIIYDQSYYGSGIFHHFQTALADPRKNIGRVCFDLAIRIPTTKDKDARATKQLLKQMVSSYESDHTPVLIAFMDVDSIATLHNLLHEKGHQSFVEKLLIITTDNAFREEFNIHNLLKNVIIVQPSMALDPVLPYSDFWRYLSGITLDEAQNQKKNNLAKVLRADNECFDGHAVERQGGKWAKECSGNETLRGHERRITVNLSAFVLNTIHRFSLALQDIINTSCSTGQYCKAAQNRFTAPNLVRLMTDSYGYNMSSNNLTYTIYQFQQTGNTIQLVDVGTTSGTFGNQTLVLHPTLYIPQAVKRSIRRIQMNKFVRPNCSKHGHFFQYSINCRKCLPCDTIYDYVVENGTCSSCPVSTVPTADGTSCTTNNAINKAYVWQHNKALCSMIIPLAAVGALLSIASLIGLVMRFPTPVVQAANAPVITIMAILAITNCILPCLAFLDVTTLSCQSLLVIFSSTLTIGITVLFCKLHGYSYLTSLQSLQETNGRSKWIAIGLMLGFIPIHILLCTFVCLKWPATLIPIKNQTIPEYYMVCSWSMDPQPVLILLIYPIALKIAKGIMASRLTNIQFAFMRKQIRYIAFTNATYTVFVGVFASLIVNRPPENRMLSFSVIVLATGWTMLVSHVIPIVYLAIFKPHMNTKKYVLRQDSCQFTTIDSILYKISIEKIPPPCINDVSTDTLGGSNHVTTNPIRL